MSALCEIIFLLSAEEKKITFRNHSQIRKQQLKIDMKIAKQLTGC